MQPIDADAVLDAIQAFITEQRIICPETIYQTDRVAENALPFIERLCDLVGYQRDDEDV
jgi:hypothetical protein